MRRVVQQLLRGVIAVALACSTLAAPSGDELEPIREILKQPFGGDERSQVEVARRLAAVRDAVPTMFRLYVGELDLGIERTGREQTEWWCPPDRFGELYLGALALVPPKEVVRFLERRVAKQPPLEKQLCIVRTLGAVHSVEGLDLLLRLAVGFDELQLRSRSIKGSLEQAFAATFAADPESLELVESSLSELPERLQVLIGEAACRAPGPRALAVLKRLVEELDEGRTQRLIAIAAMHAEHPWLFEDDAREVLLPYLHAEDWRLRRTAAAALATTGDAKSFEAIVWLLEDNEEIVRAAAARSLEELSGQSRARSSSEWLDWYAREREAWDSAFERRASDLESRDARSVMAALRELTATPLFRNQAARLLAESLNEVRKELFISICRALSQLDSRVVVPALVEKLISDDPDIRKVVLQTLSSLTGLDWDLDEEARQALLRT